MTWTTRTMDIRSDGTHTAKSMDKKDRGDMAAEAASAGASAGEEAGVMWQPQGSVSDHQLEVLRCLVNNLHGTNLQGYADLHRWSVQNYDLFWSILWKHMGVVASRQPDSPDRAVDRSTPMDKIPKWFLGAKLNYAENLLRHADDEKVALYYTSERISQIGIGKKTFGELKTNVARITASLRKVGITVGDRVAGYLPNCPEAIEIMAAVASIGAIWSSTSPDFGVNGVLDRFQQIQPKLVFSVEAVGYNGKIHDHFGKLRQVAEGLKDSLKHVVVIPFCHAQADINLLDPADSKEMFMSDFLNLGSSDPDRDVLRFEQLPFDHPLFIMYSSGTTGKPKCIVHGAGGTLLKHMEEHQIQGNRSSSDVLFYYTTVGWMMWNWLVSALTLGTTLVLYDGSPLHPHPSVMWDLVDECGITVFGTSAKWIAVQEDKGIRPIRTHRLTTLKAICSTGSPLKPNSYDYVYRDIKTDLLLASISGGTDIIACFMGENSTLPVHRGEIQSPHLGCGIESWNDEGKREENGTPGDLVCINPFPSMPVGFWKDHENSLYRAAYFEKFPGVWAHGDFISVNPKTGGMLMLGRSDGTLNPNGVRFGSAEIYNIVETGFPQIADSLCVGQKSKVDGEERVVLFLRMNPDHSFTPELVESLRKTIRAKLSARHVPALILPTQDIPYTVNGKKVEVAVKKILVGLPVNNQGALANPQSLELYKNLPQVENW